MLKKSTRRILSAAVAAVMTVSMTALPASAACGLDFSKLFSGSGSSGLSGLFGNNTSASNGSCNTSTQSCYTGSSGNSISGILNNIIGGRNNTQSGNANNGTCNTGASGNSVSGILSNILGGGNNQCGNTNSGNCYTNTQDCNTNNNNCNTNTAQSGRNNNILNAISNILGGNNTSSGNNCNTDTNNCPPVNYPASDCTPADCTVNDCAGTDCTTDSGCTASDCADDGCETPVTPPADNTNTNNNTPPTDNTDNTADAEFSRQAEEILTLVNAERAKAGLAPLTLEIKLCEAADIRAEEITQAFSHTRPDGTSCFTAVEETGYDDYRALGENIAAGQRTAEVVMDGWMNSPGHKANILSEDFTKLGIGYVKTANGYQNYWVQMFAS